MKHLTPAQASQYLIDNKAKQYPCYYFNEQGVNTNIIRNTVTAAILKYPVSVDVRRKDQCNKGSKGDYLVYNPEQGGFFFILPHEYFKEVFEPKKGNSIMEIVRDAITGKK